MITTDCNKGCNSKESGINKRNKSCTHVVLTVCTYIQTIVKEFFFEAT